MIDPCDFSSVSRESTVWLIGMINELAKPKKTRMITKWKGLRIKKINKNTEEITKKATDKVRFKPKTLLIFCNKNN